MSILDLVLLASDLLLPATGAEAAGGTTDVVGGGGRIFESPFKVFFLLLESVDSSESISKRDIEDLQLPILIVSAAFLAACR